MNLKDRLQILSESLPADMDAALITDAVSRRYLLGFPSSAGTLAVTRGKSWFIIDSRYFEAAASVIKHCEVVLQEELHEQLAGIFTGWNVKTVGVEADRMNLTEFFKLKDKLPEFEILESGFVSKHLIKQRSVKYADELAFMQAAQDIADKTFGHILGYIREGVTEREIAVEMERYSRDKGSDGTSFEFIVAAGANSSKPHAVPSDYKIRRGDFITLDFGCVKDGYHSDMTRTVAVGSVSGQQREVYDIVLEAQESALQAVKPGVSCFDVDKRARDIIDATAYKGLFGHGLGHSLGLEIHEEPRFSTKCEAVLETGMCLSVEPGIYIPGEFGVRIEDFIAVTESGCHNFCESDKKLIIV